MKKKDKIYYTGLFLDYSYMWNKIGHITNGRFERKIKRPHITFLYRPDISDYSLVGVKATVIVTGYGYNGENEGLSVSVETDNEELRKLFDAVDIPHMTLTVAEYGHSVNTRDVNFYPVPTIKLNAVYGIVTESGELITEKKYLAPSGLDEIIK